MGFNSEGLRTHKGLGKAVAWETGNLASHSPASWPREVWVPGAQDVGGGRAEPGAPTSLPVTSAEENEDSILLHLILLQTHPGVPDQWLFITHVRTH